MTKQEIETKLKNNWIKKGEGWKMYEAGKRILGTGQMSPSEYEHRMRVLTNYLKI